MNRNKRLIILSILSVLIVILITIGVTTAFMKPIEEGGNLTSVSLSSCAKITLEGTNSISLSNSYPMSKNRALQTTPYSFKVTTSCDTYVGFNLYLATLASNTLDASNIHYIITSKGSKDILSEGTLTSSLVVSDFSDAEITELNAGLGSSYGAIYKLFNERVPYHGSVEYDLYLYVDESVTSVSGTFQAGVAIKSYDREKETTLADWVRSQYTTQGANNLYYHDSTLENGANDNSYRYAGSSDTTNNFVCFGSDAETCPDDNLYRIIGVFGEQVKLIKWDYATSILLGKDGASIDNYVYNYFWNSSTENNLWDESNLNKINLNTNYLNNIGTTWANKIASTKWKVGRISINTISLAMNMAYQNEIILPAENTTYNAKVGLMYVSDYGYAANPTYWTYAGYNSSDSSKTYSAATGENWIHIAENGITEWTITSFVESSDIICVISGDGSVSASTLNYLGNVRPVFHLESFVTYGSGSGTKADPVRLS